MGVSSSDEENAGTRKRAAKRPALVLKKKKRKDPHAGEPAKSNDVSDFFDLSSTKSSYIQLQESVTTEAIIQVNSLAPRIDEPATDAGPQTTTTMTSSRIAIDDDVVILSHPQEEIENNLAPVEIPDREISLTPPPEAVPEPIPLADSTFLFSTPSILLSRAPSEAPSNISRSTSDSSLNKSKGDKGEKVVVRVDFVVSSDGTCPPPADIHYLSKKPLDKLFQYIAQTLSVTVENVVVTFKGVKLSKALYLEDQGIFERADLVAFRKVDYEKAERDRLEQLEKLGREEEEEERRIEQEIERELKSQQPQSQPSSFVMVKTADGTSTKVAIDISSTFGDLAQKFAQEAGLVGKQVHFVVDGDRMAASDTLEDAAVESGDLVEALVS